jgi:hypothetical protein
MHERLHEEDLVVERRARLGSGEACARPWTTGTRARGRNRIGPAGRRQRRLDGPDARRTRRVAGLRRPDDDELDVLPEHRRARARRARRGPRRRRHVARAERHRLGRRRLVRELVVQARRSGPAARRSSRLPASSTVSAGYTRFSACRAPRTGARRRGSRCAGGGGRTRELAVRATARCPRGTAACPGCARRCTRTGFKIGSNG